MATGLKVLIVDDEKDLLDFYSQLLSQLPSRPEVHTATTGARALALLESEPFSVLITDLNMPRMDGFQILMMVRRKFPQLRTAVITGMTDQQYRARAYAIGIDLYIEKPQSRQELQVFADCIEALLDRVEQGGFRGVQSKSLVDLVQMECFSQGSSVLKIVNGSRTGRIWMANGDIIDAEAEGELGEVAFRRILQWRTGSFEVLPPEPDRERTILTPGQSLLLDAAQWLDEERAVTSGEGLLGGKREDVLKAISRVEGVESVHSFLLGGDAASRSWGVEEPEQQRKWATSLVGRLERIGERLRVAPLRTAVAVMGSRVFAMQSTGNRVLLLGLKADTDVPRARETLHHVMGDWNS